MPEGALSHLRVLDLTRVLAGPWASQVLADLGAEVIKVERPGRGTTPEVGARHTCATRAARRRRIGILRQREPGKKSITVDLARPEGQEIVRRLSASSDVVLENYKVGALDRYGLGYQHLSEWNSRLVYCSITGFGQDGPYRDRAGTTSSSRDGRPDEHHRLAGGRADEGGSRHDDILTGMYAATAVLAALAHRERSGRGSTSNLALLDVQVATLGTRPRTTSSRESRPTGWGIPIPASFRTARSRRGTATSCSGRERRTVRPFCAVAGRPELARDPRFATNAVRVRNRTGLESLLAGIIASAPAATGSRRWTQRPSPAAPSTT